MGISSSLETYRDTVYDDLDLFGRFLPIPAHHHVFYSPEKDVDISNPLKYAFQSGSSDNVAIDFADFFQAIEIIHNRMLNFYGRTSHVDILGVMGGSSYNASTLQDSLNGHPFGKHIKGQSRGVEPHRSQGGGSVIDRCSQPIGTSH